MNYKIKHINRWYLAPGEGVTDDSKKAHLYTFEEAVRVLKRNTDGVPRLLAHISLIESETRTEIPASLIL